MSFSFKVGQPVNYPGYRLTALPVLLSRKIVPSFALFSRPESQELTDLVVSSGRFNAASPILLASSPSASIVVDDAGACIVLRHNNNCANDRGRKALRNRWVGTALLSLFSHPLTYPTKASQVPPAGLESLKKCKLQSVINERARVAARMDRANVSVVSPDGQRHKTGFEYAGPERL